MFPNFSVVKKDTNMQLRIATVTGGISGIELAIRNISPQNVISEVDSWVRDIKDANERPFQLSKWFVDIIRTYTNCLKTVGYFTNIDWKEYAENSLEEGGKETDLLIGVKRENNELKPTSLKDADAVFYQEPFVILEWEVNNLQDFCKNELGKTKKLFFGGEEIRTEGKIYGLEDIEIPKVARICFDPTRALVILNKRNSASLSIIPEIIHRVLFLLRTTMHFCILWDSRLQIFFQETNRILKGIEKAKDDTSKLFSYLEEVNNLSLRLSSTVAELFDSFVWRYPSFLPAQLGYLSTIHNKMDNILSVSIKTRNIRESVNELRQQITFAANIIREKLAEKLPQILSKVDSKEGKRKCQ